MLRVWDYVSELQPLTGLLFIPQVIYESEQPWWNDINRGKLKNREKPVPVPLHPPKTPHWLTWVQIRASMVRGLQLITWAMAWPKLKGRWRQECPENDGTFIKKKGQKLNLLSWWRFKRDFMLSWDSAECGLLGCDAMQSSNIMQHNIT
jgi:hypothetical protein